MSNPWGQPNPYGFPQGTIPAQQGAYNPQWNQAAVPNIYQYSTQPVSQFPYAPGFPPSQPPINVSAGFPAGLSYGPTVVPFAQPHTQPYTQPIAPQSGSFPMVSASPAAKPPAPSSMLYQPTTSGYSQPILQPTSMAPTVAVLQPTASAFSLPPAGSSSALLQPNVPSLVPLPGGALLQPTQASSALPPSSTPLRPTPAPERPTLQVHAPLGAPREMAKPQPKPVGPTIAPVANPLDALFGKPVEKAPAPSAPVAPVKPAAMEAKAAAVPAAAEKSKATFDWSSQDYKSIFAKAVDAPSLVATTNSFQEFPDALDAKPAAPALATVVLPPAAVSKPAASADDDEDWGAFQAPAAPTPVPPPTASIVPLTPAPLPTPAVSSFSSTTPSPFASAAVPPPKMTEPYTPLKPNAFSAPPTVAPVTSGLTFGFGPSASASSASTLLAPFGSVAPSDLLQPTPAPTIPSSSTPAAVSMDDEEFDSFQSATPVKPAAPPLRPASPPKASPLPRPSSPPVRPVTPPASAPTAAPSLSATKLPGSVFVPLSPFGKSTVSEKLAEPLSLVPSAEPVAEVSKPVVSTRTVEHEPATPNKTATVATPDNDFDFFKSAVITTVPIKPAAQVLPVSSGAFPAFGSSVDLTAPPVTPSAPAAAALPNFSAFSLPNPVIASGSSDAKSSSVQSPASVDDDEWGAFEASPVAATTASVVSAPKLSAKDSDPLASLSSTPLGSSPVAFAAMSPALASSPVAPAALSLVLSSSPIELPLTNGANHPRPLAPSSTLPQPADCPSDDLQEIFSYLVSHFRLQEAVACSSALTAHTRLPALQIAYAAAKEDDRLEEALNLKKEIDALKKSASPSGDVIAGWRKGSIVPTPTSILSKLGEAGVSEATITRLRTNHAQLFATDFAKFAQADPAQALAMLQALVAEQEGLVSQTEDPQRVLELCKQQLSSGLDFVKKARSRATEDAGVARLVFSSPKVASFGDALAVIHQIARQVTSRSSLSPAASALRQSIESIWAELSEALEREGVAVKSNGLDSSPATLGAETTVCSLCGSNVLRSASYKLRDRTFHIPCAKFYTHLYKSLQ